MEIILEERSSKGFVKDYYSQMSSLMKEYKEPESHYDILMDMVEADPILFTAVSLTVDLITHKGYAFTGKNKRELEKAKQLFDVKLDFDQVIDNILWQLIVYGDAYLEIVWNEDKTEVQELHPLETTEMVIDYDGHGEIKKYMQKVIGKSKDKWPTFEKDEVVYFRSYWVGTKVYSRCPFKSISRPYATKIHANNYLTSIFQNMPPKIIYFLKTASDAQKKQFLENLIRAKTNPNIDIVASGEAFEAKLAQVAFDNGLMNVLEYLRKEVLMITRVPPHWVGALDGANRGIGENVVIPYETKIKKIQQKIASQVNKELMPKLKLSKVIYKWNPISLIDEKEIIANMAQLSAISFDSDTIIDYGRDHGLELNPNAKIEKILPPTTPGDPQVQTDSAPSRQREGKSDKLNQSIDKKGVSQAGKAKLKSKKVAT